MIYPIVYDKLETTFTNFGLAVLEKAKDVCIRERLNGEFGLSFSLPVDDPKWEYLAEENFIKMDNQLFVIREIGDEHSLSAWRHVQCEHIFFLLIDDYIEDKRAENCTALYALTRVLEDTPFSVGTVDVVGTNTAYFIQMNPLAGINRIIERWGGEAQPDNWTVHLLQRRGTDHGVQLRYRKNLKQIRRIVDTRGVVTRLYAYGRDGITFADINDGKTYIDSSNISLWRRPKCGEIKTDHEDPAELLAYAQEHLVTLDTPFVSYEVDVVELKTLAEYGSLEAFELGDDIRVIDENLKIDIKARVVEYERYPLEPHRSRVTLANFKPGIEDELGKLKDTKETIDRAFTDAGKLNTTWLDGIIDVLRNELVANTSKITITDTDGILITNADATKALSLKGGIFALANSKDAQGNWIWRTFGTGDGFTADEINAGIINAALVQIISSDETTMLVNTGLKVFNDTGNLQAHWGKLGADLFGGKVLHADGSYTLLSAAGLLRYIAGQQKNYLFMVYSGTAETTGECYLCLTRYLTWTTEYHSRIITNMQYGGHIHTYVYYNGVEMVPSTTGESDRIDSFNYLTDVYWYKPVMNWWYVCKPLSWQNFGVGDNRTEDNGMDLITEADILVEIPHLWINLPDEWTGIDYNVTLSITSFDIPNKIVGGDVEFHLVGNPKFVLEVVEKQLSPPRFKVKAYYRVKNKWKRTHTFPDGDFIETEQNFYAKGLKFSYTVIA